MRSYSPAERHRTGSDDLNFYPLDIFGHTLRVGLFFRILVAVSGEGSATHHPSARSCNASSE